MSEIARTETLADPFSIRGGDLVFFDLEFTAWEGSQDRDWSEDWEHREIIQIGAVRVRDDAELSEIDRFLCYVSPARNPVLSDYIVALTGIEQARIDAEGFDFREAFQIFLGFCDGARAVLSYGHDWDVLAENCRLARIRPPDWSRFGSLEDPLAARAGPEFGRTTSHDLPGLVGLPPEGRAHDAMDDASSVATALRALRTRSIL